MRVTVRRRYRTGPTLPPTAAAEKRKVLPFCSGGGAPEAAGCPAPFRGGAGRDSPSAAGRGAAAPRRPSHPFPEKVFQRGWPPAGGACLHSAPTRQRQGRAARGQRAPPPARPSAGPAPPGRPRSGGLAGGGGGAAGEAARGAPPAPSRAATAAPAPADRALTCRRSASPARPAASPETGTAGAAGAPRCPAPPSRPEEENARRRSPAEGQPPPHPPKQGRRGGKPSEAGGAGGGERRGGERLVPQARAGAARTKAAGARREGYLQAVEGDGGTGSRPGARVAVNGPRVESSASRRGEARPARPRGRQAAVGRPRRRAPTQPASTRTRAHRPPPLTTKEPSTAMQMLFGAAAGRRANGMGTP